MLDELDDLLGKARDWAALGHGVALATVMRTWGSAPRPRGSHAVIRDDGLFEGSVSGGCVEGDVLVAAQALLRAGGGVERRDYGVQDENAWSFGLACGGSIAILIQTVDDAHFPPALLERIVAERRQGRAIVVVSDLATGAAVEIACDGGEDERAEERFINRYPPPLRMMIVGAVHVGQHLVPLARQLGYRVYLVDPRDGFAAASRFADIDVDPRWPDEAMADWRPDGATAVVTLSHDPKIDDPALVAALGSDAFYIAALGSRRTQASRIERLTAAGFDEAALARIDGPAGIAIAAATPAEIALSILAGATAALRGA
ncbi:MULTISPECIES: XdhC family protein [unclassified Sphingomonas]|uniref:XdhC family protein n=1 Tax=unclassified Sphingomonas TaxID=196159 RepID=UPI0006F23778|nr:MULTISPECIES: XdhC family protein [unclassified Sphingomonas]KQX20360.1 XshC-Cox1-family protein [Sphingomonas sp. Root1294]KQY67609.1 XshC-Cox1-family protein [Sphingomonas sp. Root50]KRB90775.1 XshC-Cox1-family protein [Sphingomonas sp. Root720]